MSELNIGTYYRIPFPVQGALVTSENLEEVAKWCDGEVKEADGKKFVKIPSIKSTNEKNTRAYPGAWVLKSDKSYRIYGENAFRSCFVAATAEKPKLHLV